MIALRNVEVENYRTIRKASFAFTPGLYRVDGVNNDDAGADNNGSGKSSLVESIYWGLTGKTLRDDQYADDVVRRRGDGACRVVLDLSDESGRLWRVERVRDPKKRRNALLLSVDGRPAGETTQQQAADTQAVLEDVIGADADLLRSVDFLSGSFAFLASTPGERLALLEKLLRIGVFAEARERVRAARAALDRAVRDLDSAHQLEVAKAELARSMAAGMEEKRREFEEHRDAERRVLAERLAGVASRLDVESARRAALDKEMALRASLLADQRARLDADRADPETVKLQAEAGDASRRVADLESQSTTIRARVEAARRDLPALERRAADLESKELEASQVVARLGVAALAREEELERVRAALEAFNAAGGITEVGEQTRECDALFEELSVRIRVLERARSAASAQVDCVALTHASGGECEACGRPVTDDEAGRLREALLARQRDLSVQAGECYSQREEVDAVRRQLTACESSLLAEQSALIQGKQTATREHDRVCADLRAAATVSDSAKRALVEATALAEARRAELVDLEQRAAAVGGELSALVAVRDDLAARWSAVVARRDQMAAGADSLSREVDQFCGQVSAAVATVRGLEGQRDVLASALADLDRKDPGYAGLIERERTAAAESDREAARLVAELEKQRDELRYLDWWDAGFGPSGVRNFALDAVMPELNDAVQRYMNEFSSSFQVAYSPHAKNKKGAAKEELTFEAVGRSGARCLGSGSGGEQRRMQYADLFARRDLRAARGRDMNVAVFDEALDQIDATGVERVVRVLREIAKTKCVLVITHNEHLAPWFQKVVRVTKVNDVSTVEVL